MCARVCICKRAIVDSFPEAPTHNNFTPCQNRANTHQQESRRDCPLSLPLLSFPFPFLMFFLWLFSFFSHSFDPPLLLSSPCKFSYFSQFLHSLKSPPPLFFALTYADLYILLSSPMFAHLFPVRVVCFKQPVGSSWTARKT